MGARGATSLARNLDIALISAYFILSPVLLALAHSFEIEFMNYGAPTWRTIIIYGVAAPFCGYLFLQRSLRARFAAYVYLTLDIYRSLAAVHFLPLALDAILLIYLQTRRMRSIYPALKPAEMLARLRSRFERARTLLHLLRYIPKRRYTVPPKVSATGQTLKKLQPSLISWNLTSACNLKCPHCYLDAGKKSGRELTTEECFDLIGQMSALGTEMLILTGGEPLLRKDIFSIAQYASQKGILVVMGTNGILLDEKLVTTLKESGVRGVGISLDSLDPRKHDSFRDMPGCWEKTVKAIETCARLGLPVILQTTVTEWNFEEIPALIQFAHEKGAQAFNLYYLVCTGRGERLTDITPQQYEDSLTCLIEAQANYPGMMVRAKCAPHGSRIAHQRGLPFLGSAGCPAGTSYLRITPEGDVTPCPYLSLVTGNVREKSLKLIWEESVLFNELRELQLKGRCGACEFRELCIGCRARAWAINGDYMAEDPWCQYQPGDSSPLLVTEVAWSTEAEERLQRIPSFIRGRVKIGIEGYARVKGFDTVTTGLMDEVRAVMGKQFQGSSHSNSQGGTPS